MRLYLKVFYILTVILFTAFVKLSVGVPIKDVAILALCGLLFIIYNRTFVAFFADHRSVILVFVVFAAIGTIITVLNHQPPAHVINAFLRVIVQPFLILCTTYVVTQVYGVRFAAGVFIALAMATGLVAIIQFAGLDAAWAIKRAIGKVQSEPSYLLAVMERQGRPMGISLTPIVYSYHIASAYVLLSILHRAGYLSGRHYAFLASFLMVAALVNGTRSLVLGIIVHEILHNIHRINLTTVVSACLLVGVGMGVHSFLESSGSRIANVSDASALGRFALYEYGLLLARDYPIGLGWGFDPSKLAWLYWEHFADSTKSESVFHLKIHNAFLNFALTYGFLGLLVIAFSLYLNPRVFILILFSFSGYLVHSLFHNDGVFLGDNYVWYAFAIFFFIQDAERKSKRAFVRNAAPQQPGSSPGVRGRQAA